MFLRRTLHETTTKRRALASDAGSFGHIWRNHRAAFLTVLGFTAGGSLIFYTFTTYMQKFLINSAGMSKTAATDISLVTLFIYMCAQPLFGSLSDRIGRRNSMLLFGGPRHAVRGADHVALGHVSSPLEAGVLITIALAIISLYTSISGIVKAEMFPVEVRALGVGLAYAISNALFGGSAEGRGAGVEELERRIALLLVRDGDDGDRLHRRAAAAQDADLPARRPLRTARAVLPARPCSASSGLLHPGAAPTLRFHQPVLVRAGTGPAPRPRRPGRARNSRSPGPLRTSGTWPCRPSSHRSRSRAAAPWDRLGSTTFASAARASVATPKEAAGINEMK
jgi:hypothetical protein